MGFELGKIIDTVKDAMANPELDKTRSETKKALEEVKKSPNNSNLSAVLLDSGLRGLRDDLNELKVNPNEWTAFEDIYRERFALATKGLENQAIIESLEAKKLDDFINDYAEYAKLNAVIQECQKKDSKSPLKQFIRFIQKNSSLFEGLGGGIFGWLTPEKDKDETTETPAPATIPPATPTSPSNLDESAKKADELLADETEKDKNEEAPKKKTSVESAGSAKYEPIPRLSEKALTGTDFMDEYEKLESPKQRHMLVLQQLAIGNVPEHFTTFETLKITGEKGTVVEIEVARHGLRIGTDADYVELPLDGPTAMAAAEIYGCTLATPWISDQIHQRAKESGGRVDFIAAPQIAQALGITNWNNDRPDGAKMMSPEFIKKRNELLKAWREANGIKDDQLTSGYFKDIVHPVPGKTKAGRLEIYGGAFTDTDLIQKVSHGHHEKEYFDYSHLARFVRGTIKVNGQAMSLSNFTNSKEYSEEFGFDQMELGQAYPYPPELRSFVNEHKATPANE